MPRKLIALVGFVALSACGGGAPAAEVAEETPVVCHSGSEEPIRRRVGAGQDRAVRCRRRAAGTPY